MSNFLYDILTIYHDVHFRSAACSCHSPRQGRSELRGSFAEPLVYKNLLALTALAPDYGRWPWGILGNDDKEIVRKRFLSAIGKIYQRKTMHNFLRDNANNLNHFVREGILSPDERDILAAFAGKATEYVYLECVPDQFLRTLLLPECERREISLEEFVADYINDRYNHAVVSQSAVLTSAHLRYFECLKSEMASHIYAAAAESALNEPARILLRLLHPDLSRRESDLISFALLISFIVEHPQYFGNFNYRNGADVANNFSRCLFRACGYVLAEGENDANADIQRIKQHPSAKPTPVSPAQFHATLMAEAWGADRPSIDDDAVAARSGVEDIVSSYDEAVGMAVQATLRELRAGHQTFGRVMAGVVSDEAKGQDGWQAYCFLAGPAVGRMRTYYEEFSRVAVVQPPPMIDDDE